MSEEETTAVAGSKEPVVEPAVVVVTDDNPTAATTKREDTVETEDMESSSSVATTSDNNNNAITETEKSCVDNDADALLLLSKAKEYLRKDQVLAASRMLKQMTTAGAVLTEEDLLFRTEVEKKTALIEHVIADLLSDPEVEQHNNDNEEKQEGAGDTATAAGDDTTTATTPVVPEEEDGAGTAGGDKWIKIGESHDDHRDTVMYYQLTEDLQLKCRLESPIESSLLVPLLSVLIETDLYTTWLPQWYYPRLGVEKVTKLSQLGRTEQIVQFVSAVPWPFAGRDVMLQTCACDDIDDIEAGPTTGTIAIGLVSMEEGTEVRKSTVCHPHYENAKDVLVIPPPPEGLKRAEFDGGLLIRKCPEDHVTLQHSTIDYPSDEHLILVGFSMFIDGKISPMFPSTVINFVIQTAIKQMWSMFLKVAEEIRAGSRPQHTEAIAAKREEIYDWVDMRIEKMFSNLQQKTDDKKSSSHGALSEDGSEEKKEEIGNAETTTTD